MTRDTGRPGAPSYTLRDPLPAPHPTGKNVRRSIQGVGHMMSTMVLNRKQSVFGGPSLPAGAGAPEPLDRSKFEENEDIVVMETKLKILEILQVAGPGVWRGMLGRGWGAGSRAGWVGEVSTSEQSISFWEAPHGAV